MKPKLRILSGARAGTVLVLSKPQLVVGRHRDSDIRFDAERDLDVSTRHAQIEKKGDHWVVRDLGSRNGTFVNGHRLTGETRLDKTDQVRFGIEGPSVEFMVVPDSTPDTVDEPLPARDATVRPSAGAHARPAAPSPPAVERPSNPIHSEPSVAAAAKPRSSTTQRIRVEVARQTRRLRMATGILAFLVIGIGGGLWFESTRRERLRAEEVAAMQARTDSILAAADDAVRGLQGQVQGLENALRSSQGEVQQLQTRLAAAEAAGDATQVASLRQQLEAAGEALRRQQVAARLDFRGIYDGNQRAIALVYVEFGPGEVYTGTAFAVRRDGTMITNRHVVAGADGSRRPTRLAIQFADSPQVWPATILAISEDTDLAIVRAENILGDVPTVQPLTTSATAIRPGEPVAVIGFPLGAELPMATGAQNQRIARTTFTAGTVSKVLPELVQLDGYGAEGSSGSPIFDSTGQVIGIVYGGQSGSGGRVVFGVPSRFAAHLLSSVAN